MNVVGCPTPQLELKLGFDLTMTSPATPIFGGVQLPCSTLSGTTGLVDNAVY